MDNFITEDPDLALSVPDCDEKDPEVSIVIPALNEEITIGDFVDWCKEGIKKAGVRGEVLIVDSSTDKTPLIALGKGARVLHTPKRGLGRAYIDAIPYIRGKYVLLGDCDCTYDFRDISHFLEKFRAGCEFIMGSRFKGRIEKGAMPPLHRYFGTPVTTWLLNFVHQSRFSDIHCGMRGITRDAFIRMDLHSQAWEYAPEMIIKSIHMGLKSAESPVTFWKDREGRRSHLQAHWYTPWYAGWITLRAIFIHKVDFFLYKPGLVILLLGLLLMVLASFNDITIGPITFSLYWMLLGLVIATLGIQSFFWGLTAKVLYDYQRLVSPGLLALFSYTRSTVLSAGLFILGIAMTVPLVREYLSNDFTLPSGAGRTEHTAVLGLLFIIIAFANFTSTLMLHAASIYSKKREYPKLSGKV